MPDLDLLVIGDCNPDLVVLGTRLDPAFGQAERVVDDASLFVGGSAAITACGAARLGLRVGLASVVGDDLFGRFMLDALTRRGVDTGACTVDEELPTGLTIVFVRPDGDRAMLTAPGTVAALRGELITPATLRSARHVHLSSYFLQTGLQSDVPQIFKKARAAGRSTSLDTGWDPDEQWDGGLWSVLEVTDCLLPNAEEARRISRETDVDAAACALALSGTIVAVKLGAAGGLVRRGEQRITAPSLPGKVVDTIGAGDSFNAGFLAGRLRDLPLEKCLRLASICGSLSTRAPGGIDAQPTLAEALEALAQVA